MKRFYRIVLAGGLMLVSTGCYKFVPTTLDQVPTGTRVRTLLSTEGQVELEERIGLNSGLVVGELLEWRGDSVLMSLPSVVQNSSGFGASRTFYQRVDVPRAHILRVDERRVDGARTAALGAMAAGAIVLVLTQAFGEQNPGDPTLPPGGPDERRGGWVIQFGLPIP